MSEYILTTLDNRKIKPTPNNPVSSRSHVIIFVKFTNGNETRGNDSHPLETSGLDTNEHETKGSKFNSNLIICDFAGVENRFNCDDITDFLKLENDKRINTDYVKFFNEHCSPDNKYIDYNKKLIKNISNDFISFKSTPQNLKETIKGGEVKVINDLIKQLNLFWESNREELLNIFYSDPNLIETNILKYLNTENKFGSKNFVFNFVVDGKQITISNPQTKKQINKKILELSTQYLLTQLFTYFKQTLLKGNVANIFTVLNDKIVYESCNERVKEGEFINKSLEDFRNAISKYVNPSGKLPEFNNECLPLQCNPMYEECFGNDRKEEKVVKSQLLDVITDKLGNTGDKIIKFCIFNVVNLSGNKNHMIHRYIDISDVVYEYNRLKNYEYQQRYFPHFNPSESESTFQSIFSLFSIINGYNGDNINPDILNKILTIGLNLSEYINNIKKTNNRDTILTNLNSIIDIVAKYNSITAIGTMEYLDMMAKYGVNKTICNFNINVNDTNKNLNIIVDEYKLKINKYLENKYKFGLSDKFI
jgi:predicted RNA-binding protein with PIN domain